MRPSVRFEVFKRDQFTCAYCGRKPPDVTLQVDHVIPCAEGGDDDIENLVTACFDCNIGKGAIPLDAPPEDVPTIAERTELLRERERQLHAYHAVLEEKARREDAQVERVWNAWFAIWDVDTLPGYQVPAKSTIRRYLELLGEGEVMVAIERIGDKFWRNPSNDAVRYFYGILKWKLAENEHRVVLCAKCGDRVMLEPGDDRTAEWIHTGCAEERA